MRLKRPLILITAALFLTVTLLVVLAPVIVANGLRLWAERVARREGFLFHLDGIDAPLFRPVVVRNLRVESGPAALFQINCSASRLELALNLTGIFTGSRRPLRSLNIDGLTLNICRRTTSTSRR
jgi:hypothetical protein